MPWKLRSSSLRENLRIQTANSTNVVDNNYIKLAGRFKFPQHDSSDKNFMFSGQQVGDMSFDADEKRF